jgi:hypothetical protein
LGGYLLNHEWPLQYIFLIFGVPLLLASAGVVILGGVRRLTVREELAAGEGATA